MNIEEAISLIHLARHQQDLGVHEQAAVLFEQAIAILRRYVLTSRKELAIALNDYGRLQNSLGLHEDAIEKLNEAVAHQVAIFGKIHSEVATTYNNLGLIYKTAQQYDVAKIKYDKARHIYESLGLKTIAVANNLNNLALVYEALGDHTKALLYFEEALTLQRQLLGNVHPQLAITLYNLAALLVAKQPTLPYSPVELMREANKIDDIVIDTVFGRASETGRLRYLGKCFPRYHIFLSYVHRQWERGHVEDVAEAYSLVLRRKCLATEISTAKQTAVWHKNQPESTGLLTKLSQLRQEIAQKSINPSISADTLQPLLQEKEQLEVKLAAKASAFSIRQDLGKITHQQVGKALPEDAAFIEFVRFEPFNFTAVLKNKERRHHPSYYIAFLILANQPEKIQLFDLGPAKKIDQRISGIGFRLEQAGQHAPQDKPIENWLHIAQLEPLWKAVGDCSHLFIAPDGNLSLLSFAILLDGNGRHLIDSHTISYLMTGRDLLFTQPPAQNSSSSLVITNPDYAFGQTQIEECTPFFRPLQEATDSWQKIEKILRTKPIMGKEATTQRIKEQISPKILHLNTHGVFYTYKNPDDRVSDESENSEPFSINQLRQNRNALLRGGLAFAGANRWACGFPLSEPIGSGILTAEEIRNLNLTQTELVVLSACDTGVGDALAGEAVFGFRRAFVIAGVRTVVMSLWKVLEKYSATLMYYFYAYLEAGLPRTVALRKAQLDLREKDKASVFGWGAFICQGNIDPLSLN
ncbi:MAG: hypothetical protein DHS20C20_08140 [Ardenticatenaceae bacterium]|nr:MAG: hypothetical protein DHS20C20_08140 [Ardenticatenaceae bacterium]